jgi:hypothetical protein
MVLVDGSTFSLLKRLAIVTDWSSPARESGVSASRWSTVITSAPDISASVAATLAVLSP